MASCLPGLSYGSSDIIPFKLTLIRHGVTIENQLSIIQGQTDTKLSEEGIFQAKCLAKPLSKIKYSLVTCSPLIRARDTAKYALSLNKHEYKVKFDGRLMERAFGNWEGVKVGETRSLPRIGVETVGDMLIRVKSFLKDLCLFVATKCEDSQASDPAHILVVTHGGVIASVLKCFRDDFKLDVPSAKDEMIQNTSVTTFIIRVKKDKSVRILDVKCLADRDISHLEGVAKSHI